MKRLLVLLAVAIAFTLTAAAQETSTQSTTSTTATKKAKAAKSSVAETPGHAAKPSTLTGCIAKSAEGSGFVLTNARHKKGVEISSSDDLRAHVGHEVKLTGSWEKGAAGETGAAAKMKKFNAEKLDMVSDTCTKSASPAKEGEPKGTKKTGAMPPGF